MLEMLGSLSDYIGLVGVVLILIGYFFINTGRLTSKSLAYLALNFFGAWLILFSLLFHWNLASVIIECAWIIISLVGFYRLYRSRTGY